MENTAPRVLYIDDDAGLCRLVQNDLRRNGYAVEVAQSGAAGLERLRTGSFDVVALDHHMPGQTGLETLGIIGALPEPPPVVYVTGEAEGRVAIAALKAGAADYVIKEVSEDFLPLLRATLAAAIEKSQLRRAREQAEDELRASRDRFQALAAEREVLIHEINHRVANSLQIVSAFLRIQWSHVASPDAKAALANAIARMEAIGHVHNQLYAVDDIHAVDLAKYLHDLFADLEQIRNKDADETPLLVEVDPITTTTDRALGIGIIVTELVIDALKQAHPQPRRGRVRVSCRTTAEGGLILAVEDELGLPPGEAEGSDGLGKRLIGMMATKLDATVEQDHTPNGFRVVVRIPPPKIQSDSINE